MHYLSFLFTRTSINFIVRFVCFAMYHELQLFYNFVCGCSWISFPWFVKIFIPQNAYIMLECFKTFRVSRPRFSNGFLLEETRKFNPPQLLPWENLAYIPSEMYRGSEMWTTWKHNEDWKIYCRWMLKRQNIYDVLESFSGRLWSIVSPRGKRLIKA